MKRPKSTCNFAPVIMLSPRLQTRPETFPVALVAHVTISSYRSLRSHHYRHPSLVAPFLPRDAVLARYLRVYVCLSVCPSVCHKPVLQLDTTRWIGLVNIWQSYKQERGCLMHIARLANTLLKDEETAWDILTCNNLPPNIHRFKKKIHSQTQ